MSSMKACPFDGCGSQIPAHLFACGPHWRGLSDNARNAVNLAAAKYRGDEISTEEFQQLTRAVVDDAQPQVAAAATRRPQIRPYRKVCRRCAKAVFVVSVTLVAGEGRAESLAPIEVEEVPRRDLMALGDDPSVVGVVLGGEFVEATGHPAAMTRFKIHVCGRVGP